MTFKTFFLILVLLAAGALGYLRYEAAQTTENYFNQTRRYVFGKSDLWRWALNLSRVGDGKGQYLAGGQPIVIEVVTSKGTEINEEGLYAFAREVERITGRKTNVINVDFMDLALVKNTDLENLTSSFRRHRSYNQPDIFVVYASDFEGSENSPAKPFNAFGIVISDQKLKDLTSFYSQAIRDYLPAVMLNSFGQQLGLSQSKSAGCIMQDIVLHPTSALQFPGQALPTKYCDAELAQAKSIGESLR